MKCRVLYVDDETANLVVFEAACAHDFDVLTATSAEQALETMRRVDVGVLLTDQRMPGTTGVTLAAAVREEFPDTIRMLVTAYADLDSAIDAINLGQVHRYLRKPWDIRDLRATLKEACELHRMNRAMADLRRRLLETERVYAIGVVAASIGRELTRPIGHLNEALTTARQLVAAVSASPDLATKRARYDVEVVDSQLANAQVFAGRILELLRGMDLPLRGRARADREEETVALDQVIRMALKVLRGEFRSRAQIKLDVKPVPLVHGSSAGLSQVILNLLVNALQSFAPEPGRAPKPDNLVTLRLFPRDAAVCVEVEDNGVPIPAESVALLFDPLRNPSAEGGHRWGLAISKRIVDELGGRIEVERPSEGGTRLRLVLPSAG